MNDKQKSTRDIKISVFIFLHTFQIIDVINSASLVLLPLILSGAFLHYPWTLVLCMYVCIPVEYVYMYVYVC